MRSGKTVINNMQGNDNLHQTPVLVGGYNPLDDLFIAQLDRPTDLGELNLRALSPFLRSLLVIDGTVTKFIEAYTMEPVRVIKLAQGVKDLLTEHKWLEAPGGTRVIVREVLMKGEYSDRLYAYALSLIVIDRLPLDMQTRLEKDHEGLGRVLLSSRLESYRDVLWYGKEPAERLPKAVRQMVDREFVTRTYRIISNGKPVMLISEKFPLGGETDVAHE